MPALAYRSYAKLNLTLEVIGRRRDGYHELASLVHTIGLADDLHLELADELLTRVEGLDLDPQTNLVTRAAEALFEVVRPRMGADVTLRKRIPVAAGLGGGSSDAATTLIGLNTLWGTPLRLPDLVRLAAKLGSDVPFFIRGGAAVMRGRGEHLQPLPPLTGQWFVIAAPQHALADKTRLLYAALETADFSSGECTALAASRLRQRLPLVEDQLSNAFSRAALATFPGLGPLWKSAEDVCERRFFLSGAGPALFALAADRADARRQQTRLAGEGLGAHIARTVKHGRAALRFPTDSAIGYA